MHHIWYHSPCVDGLGAAYAAWAQLGDAPQVRYTPVAYGRPLPDICPGDEVTLLDFSAPRADLLRLAQLAERITLIDHHASAERALAGLPEEAMATEGCCEIRVSFDLEHSGAVLAWHHFHWGTPVPRLLDLIEDRDLWRFASPDSQPLHYALETLTDFRDLREPAVSPTALLDFIGEGRIILEYLEHQWTAQASRAGLCTLAWFDGQGLDGDNPPCILCPCPSPWFSDVGHGLLEQYPEAQIAVLYNDHIGDEQVTVSLRSRPDGPDVSVLAARLGGGGHPRAAGFHVPLAFPISDAGTELPSVTVVATPAQEAA